MWAHSLPLGEVVKILLSVAPVGLDLQSKERRFQGSIEFLEASMVHRDIDVSTLFEHGSRFPD